MSKLSKLLQVTEEEKHGILKHYDMSEEQFDERVEMLRDWAIQCEHLPREDNRNKYRVALLNAKMSMEKAKQSLEGYYRVRTRYSNEMFDKLIPNSKDYIEGKKFVTVAIIPNLTPDLCRITLFKISDPNGEAYDAYLYELVAMMMGELRIAEDLFLSNILIVDFADYGWKNLIKFTPTINQNLVDMLMTVKLRIHSVHFVNLSNVMDQIMRLLKSLLPSKLVGKIRSHKSYESLLNYIPAECIPSDYGGTQKSSTELFGEWCEQIEESEEMFQKLLDAKCTKKTDLDREQQEMFGCGAEGSFRQLTLD